MREKKKRKIVILVRFLLFIASTKWKKIYWNSVSRELVKVWISLNFRIDIVYLWPQIFDFCKVFWAKIQCMKLSNFSGVFSLHFRYF